MRRLSDHGVSEAIGFVIMFSLIVTGIGIVTLYGYPMLTEQRASSDEKAMERTMISVQNDMKLLTYSNIPYKDSAINVAGGALTVFNDTTRTDPQFEIKYFNVTSGLEDTISFSSGVLEYTSDAGNGIISLQNGAVVKRQEQESGSYMIAEPRWFIDTHEIGGTTTKTLVIYLMKIDADSIMANTGVSNLRMSRLEAPMVIDRDYGGGSPQVKVRLDGGNFTTAWGNYFTQSLGMTLSGGHYVTNVNRLVIKQYNVTVENL
jgi:hypothetical protein